MKVLRILPLVALGAALAGCSDPEGARRALEDQGYTNVEMIGSPWFGGCDKEDYYVDEFRAMNVAGRPVHGVVCSGIGWGKATTIRFYAPGS